MPQGGHSRNRTRRAPLNARTSRVRSAINCSESQGNGDLETAMPWPSNLLPLLLCLWVRENWRGLTYTNKGLQSGTLSGSHASKPLQAAGAQPRADRRLRACGLRPGRQATCKQLFSGDSTQVGTLAHRVACQGTPRLSGGSGKEAAMMSSFQTTA